MPIIKSAKKAARQAEKRTAHNQQIKKDIKTAIKAFKKTPTGENLKKAKDQCSLTHAGRLWNPAIKRTYISTANQIKRKKHTIMRP